MTLQAEVLPTLQYGESPQADHEAVRGIGPQPKFKDGSTATPLSGQSETRRVRTGQLSLQQGAKETQGHADCSGFQS